MKIFLETEEDLEKYVNSKNFKNEEVIVNGNTLTNVINSYKNDIGEANSIIEMYEEAKK